MAIGRGYAMHFVADMGQAVAFYHHTVGLELRFGSPGGHEFATGATTLGLHPASPENPSGSARLGRHADDLTAAHRQLSVAGVRFARPPTPEHGVMPAEFVDRAGARVSLSG